ncbi:serine hydrolase [Enterococcus thailandicus]|uniref:serine hydrolase n=1 Tax=Enterococcus thailandicus TaxID=417368 RepID=UPI0022E94BF9|nr:serine hydrolase [Enterococcus thailandicus]HCQ1093067.1 serine hydrolase [Listeria monocytogenes]
MLAASFAIYAVDGTTAIILNKMPFLLFLQLVQGFLLLLKVKCAKIKAGFFKRRNCHGNEGKDKVKQYRKRVVSGIILFGVTGGLTFWGLREANLVKPQQNASHEVQSTSKESTTDRASSQTQSSSGTSGTTAFSSAGQVFSTESSGGSSTAASTMATETTADSEAVPTGIQQAAASLAESADQVAYAIEYFQSGQQYTNHNRQPLIAASVIKVFVMEYVYLKGLDLNQTVAESSLGDLVRQMIQVSDNQATNQIIEFIGMSTLNEYFQAAGYPDTVLEREMLDTTAQRAGKENYTSVPDVMTFLQRLYEHQGEAPYGAMLQIMMGQQVRTKIPAKLSAAIPVANKTGELAGVENDIGIVFADHPFAIAVLSNGVSDSGAMREAIGNLAFAAAQ